MTAVCEKAPAGPKEDSALEYYQAPEKPNAVRNDAELNKELDTGTHALE